MGAHGFPCFPGRRPFAPCLWTVVGASPPSSRVAPLDLVCPAPGGTDGGVFRNARVVRAAPGAQAEGLRSRLSRLPQGGWAPAVLGVSQPPVMAAVSVAFPPPPARACRDGGM